MRILGIETSCDETSLALIEAKGTPHNPHFRVIKNIVSSQIKIHAPFGGVVPNLAKREHLKNLPLLWKRIKEKGAGKKEKKTLVPTPYFPLPAINLITVTVGPGLEPALWTGITFAQKLQKEYEEMSGKKVPLVGANHLEGHVYSFLLPKQNSKFVVRNSDMFPAISLLVSGGHTILLLVKDLYHWKKIGETRDDAVGEAFDKVARILGFSYPGGPEIEKHSAQGNPCAIEFPRPMIDQKNYDFSFSGLKTAVLYFLREKKNGIGNIEYGISNKPTFKIRDVAASFQSAALDVLVKKTIRAAREFGAKSIMLSGGVASNKTLRKMLQREAKKIGTQFIAPEKEYNTDNAAMIAVAGYMSILRKTPRKKYRLEAQGNLNI
ncbi:MAG: tRNA (adenosine(37)-N6)-threonylcarbamoyltransferase complex transferase subunit TsaD [Patescibacteria group bacterium]|nr:tRNA (adenosine(37)-N6)-threonylcarbamoyltransferase complex transferase subunit TsaD [Patescibacteria group bacterium]